MTEDHSRYAPGGGKLYIFNGKWPVLGAGVFIAPGARIIGDVEIGEGSSVWFNCVLRGDVNHIRVGRGCNIQDNTVVHVEGGGAATLIGDDVLIGHNAMIHGTTIEDRGFVGLGAVTMDGSYIESDAMLGAGGLLSPEKRMRARELWLGRPAKKIRDLTDTALQEMLAGTEGYRKLAEKYLWEYDKCGSL